jgi:hypothetical protein
MKTDRGADAARVNIQRLFGSLRVLKTVYLDGDPVIATTKRVKTFPLRGKGDKSRQGEKPWQR